MKLKFLSLFILSLSVFGFIPTASLCQESSKSESWNLGVLLCLSGNCADWGTAALRGAEIATREINASGGVLGRQIKLHVEDTRESINGAQAPPAFSPPAFARPLSPPQLSRTARFPRFLHPNFLAPPAFSTPTFSKFQISIAM